MTGRSSNPAARMPASSSTARLSDYDRLAAPVIAFADRIDGARRGDTQSMLREAGFLLDRFSADLRSSGVPVSTVAPARYALALMLDQSARRNRALDLTAWTAGAQNQLFDGRDMSIATLRDFVRRAETAGPDFAQVHQFLEECLKRLEGVRQHYDRGESSNWTGIVAVLVAAFCLAVLGWAGYVEWRHQSALLTVFRANALEIGLDRAGDIPDLAARLDRMNALAGQVEVEAARVPVHLFSGLVFADAGAAARAEYQAAVDRHVPPILATAVDTAFATEGGAVDAYDTLRAWAVLSGNSQWSPVYLAGWASDRAVADPTLAGLSPHILRLSQPAIGTLKAPDAELRAQAEDIAKTAGEAERAFLELRRSGAAAALPGWVAEQAVPGISQVLQHRSGAPMSQPVPGLFTQAGWALARDTGAGLAVQTTRAQMTQLLPDARPDQPNDTPDRVLDLLQQATVKVWADYLADLQVRPFNDPDIGLEVSGQLAQPNSPLTVLFREVWAQAGGNDRSRSHAQQITVAAQFAAMIQYVEQGRMDEIARLFAGLNVALGAMDRGQQAGVQRLMTVQDRARSISTLSNAPVLLAAVVEDVLAQTGASHADPGTNPLTKAWQAEVLPTCSSTADGRFPFVATGADADPAAVMALLGPGGAIDRYIRLRATQYLDTTASPWRWKPEARFAGLHPESAEYLQKAAALASALAPKDGQLGSSLSLAALAERGRTFVAIGGQGGPVETQTDVLTLAWPGPQPEKGVEVSFQTGDGGSATLNAPGPWGLLHLLAPLRLRERDGGKRFLIDLRSGDARLFVEMSFPTEANLLSQRTLLGTFTCPKVL